MKVRRALLFVPLVAVAATSAGLHEGPVRRNATADAPKRALSPDVWLAGVNLAGAEFGETRLPGTYGKSYTYPTTGEVDYFVGEGMNVFRIPFRWERLQRAPFGELDGAERQRLDRLVTYATGTGAWVVLDPHNFARYHDEVIGSPEVPVAAFADLWRRLAELYRDDHRVIFGLVNEPHGMPTEQWVAAANAAIAAIRDTGAKNLVLVPGNGFTGAHGWFHDYYGTPNAEALLDIRDPVNRFAFEVHQYLDFTTAGVDPTCIDERVGVERVEQVTAWLRAHGRQAFLGELAGGPNPTCDAAVDALLRHLEGNRDVWIGWAWWAAGPWWGDYFFSLAPRDGEPAPQMAVLREHLE